MIPQDCKVYYMSRGRWVPLVREYRPPTLAEWLRRRHHVPLRRVK